MAKKYIIRYSGHSVEMSKPSSTVIIYKIPYRHLQLKNYGFEIPNQFIVYILFGKNNKGMDAVYVGKSKNGLSNRPTSHADKFEEWNFCFVLTQFKERTFFNDGTIQYLEDKLNKRINTLGTFQNTTEITATGTANKSDEEDCDDYLEEAYDMLYVLGLNLYTAVKKEDSATIEISDTHSDNAESSVIPDGEYYMARTVKRLSRTVCATAIVKDGKFIVQAGSDIAEGDAKSISTMPSVQEIRQSQEYVKDGKLLQNVSFDSPSLAASLVYGGATNGWYDWKTKDWTPINSYRNR